MASDQWKSSGEATFAGEDRMSFDEIARRLWAYMLDDRLKDSPPAYFHGPLAAGRLVTFRYSSRLRLVADFRRENSFPPSSSHILGRFQRVGRLCVVTSRGPLLAKESVEVPVVRGMRRMTGAQKKGRCSMRIAGCALYLILLCEAVIVTIPLDGHSAETIKRTVRGNVVATNLLADPQTIVVTVLLANKMELIVGARVPADTRITRGTKAAHLAELKVGEPAEVTYLKQSDGLIARSIHVR